jgi:hypothetical protein
MPTTACHKMCLCRAADRRHRVSKNRAAIAQVRTQRDETLGHDRKGPARQVQPKSPIVSRAESCASTKPALPTIAFQQLTSLSGVRRQSRRHKQGRRHPPPGSSEPRKKLGRASKRAKNEFLPTVDPISRRTPSSGGPKLRSALSWSFASQNELAQRRLCRSASRAVAIMRRTSRLKKGLSNNVLPKLAASRNPSPRAHRRRRAHPGRLHAMSVLRKAASFSSVAPVERADPYRRIRAAPKLPKRAARRVA